VSTGFAEPDDGFKPAVPLTPTEIHDQLAKSEQTFLSWDSTNDPRCGICNARPGQRHLPTGRYP
jgi:hypothetical protein